MDDGGKTKRVSSLLWGVRRSVRYHDRRQGFFERWHVLVMLMALLGGSTTIAAFGSNLLESWPPLLKFLPAALITVFSAADLAIGFAAKAALYGELKRRFIRLERELLPLGHDPDPPEDEINRLWQERLAIEADEPPVLFALNTICHNELLRAEGRDEKGLRQIPLLTRWLAPFCDWRPHAIK